MKSCPVPFLVIDTVTEELAYKLNFFCDPSNRKIADHSSLVVFPLDNLGALEDCFWELGGIKEISVEQMFLSGPVGRVHTQYIDLGKDAHQRLLVVVCYYLTIKLVESTNKRRIQMTHLKQHAGVHGVYCERLLLCISPKGAEQHTNC